ncbi:MAG: hypothetical protein K5852_07045 [Eubacterium sp.]|nr:hypothetical protein [Eubacterium sp.]
MEEDRNELRFTKKENFKRVNVRMPKDVYDKLDEIKQQAGIRMNDVILRMLDYGLSVFKWDSEGVDQDSADGEEATSDHE